MAGPTPIHEAIDVALKEALKAKEATKLDAIRMLKAALKNKEIDKRAPLEEAEIHQLVQTLIKQRREAIDLYRKGGREELAAKEEAEIKVLGAFMPQQLSEAEVLEIVRSCIRETNAKGAKDMGAVMKAAMAKLKGRAEGGLINKLVKDELSRL